MSKDACFWTRASDVHASLLSLFFCFWNVVANVWTMVIFYQEQHYFSMGVFIFLTLSSSVLLETFSWLWYSDSSEYLETDVERFTDTRRLLALVHVLQLGVVLRCLGMLEISVRRFEQEEQNRRLAEILGYDLTTLCLFKAFSESAPQLILMLTNIIHVQDFQLYTVVKILASLSSLSFTVLSYHRCLHEFVSGNFKTGWSSSIIYFLWNLFLIGPRVMCVSLFASVLPCYVPAHFLSLWMLLVLWAWWQKTDFMDSKAGEWLYRATVALIWYFSWFSVTSGSTKHKGIIYHTVMGVDTMLLLGLWWWRRSVESAQLTPLPINIYGIILILITSYIVGVLLKLLYYWKFHPKRPDLQIHVSDGKSSGTPQAGCFDTVDFLVTSSAPTRSTTTGIQKRKRNMAVNFYS